MSHVKEFCRNEVKNEVSSTSIQKRRKNNQNRACGFPGYCESDVRGGCRVKTVKTMFKNVLHRKGGASKRQVTGREKEGKNTSKGTIPSEGKAGASVRRNEGGMVS